jgi:Zinc-binding dehydrogenase/Protein of unknown function (DUF4230)
MGKRGFLTLVSLLAAVLLLFYVQNQKARQPDVTAIAMSTVQSLSPENKLIVFSASLTVMTTGKTRADAFLQQKTILVQPALVHYGVDLSKLTLRHDVQSKRLIVMVPDVSIVARDIDPARKEEVLDSSVIAKLNSTEATLAASLRELVWPAFDAGRCLPVIDSVFPLEKACDAHIRIDAGAHIGKIVLEVKK